MLTNIRIVLYNKNKGTYRVNCPMVEKEKEIVQNKKTQLNKSFYLKILS
jgi:hypothetical protein